jgi:ribose transport system substrate-binding protein
MKKAHSFSLGLLAFATASGFAQETPLRLPPGPPAQPEKTVVFIASDYKNGGPMGVYRGFEEAAQKLGWQVRVEDGGGKKAAQAALLSKAIASRAQGIIIGGFDPNDFVNELAAARRNHVVLVGWHAAKDAGPTKDLFVNISTRPVDVAELAVDYVIRDAMTRHKPVGAVIFNDNQYAVANAKTDAMKKALETCAGYKGCKLLSIENIPISDAAQAIPAAVPKLAAAHGTEWTYSLAINDAYFDEINYPLVASKRTDIINVSAGDGSTKALGRIGAGVSRQAATIAEPIKLQGYQLADELNRAFAGAPPSGFQSKPILVTADLLKKTGSKGIEADLSFEAAYSAIWARK